MTRLDYPAQYIQAFTEEREERVVADYAQRRQCVCVFHVACFFTSPLSLRLMLWRLVMLIGMRMMMVLLSTRCCC